MDQRPGKVNAKRVKLAMAAHIDEDLPKQASWISLGSMPNQFENLRASELYCPRCKTARPVRERLLLVLPHGELHDYRCQVCGDSLGSKEVSTPPPGLVAKGRPETPRQRS